MSGLRKQFKTDPVKEVEGVAIELHEAQNDDGSIPTFILSRMGGSNKAYSKALDTAMRPYRRQMELKTFKNETAEVVVKSVFVDIILKGWKNVQDDNGVDIEFSKEAALALFDEEGMQDLYSRLQVEANEIANYLLAAREVDSGN